LSASKRASQSAPPRLCFRVPAQPSHLLRARERLRDYLRQYCADGQVIDDTVLCVEEAATNAIRHSGSRHTIEISVRFVDGDLVAEVKDQGRGFDLTAFDREAQPDPLSDHGRGLFIIAKLMDSLDLRLDNGLEVRMARRAASRAEPLPFDSALGDALDNRRRRNSRTRAMLEEIDEGFVALDWEYRYTHLNEAMLRLMGRSRDEVLGKLIWELFPGLGDTPVPEHCRAAMELGKPSLIEHRSLPSGDWFEMRIYPTSAGISIYFRQINERKRAELERETTIGFLRLINESDELVELVRSATTFFQQQSGCEAVGIRLRDGDDYPYFEARGFPEHFVLLENELCARDAVGQICRDEAGYPIMECVCGNVVCGRFDAAQDFFTDKGSFWTGNTTLLLATSSEEDRQARTRNRCNGEGYESVALIALRVGEERLGLLQLNDRRIGRFAAEDVALWERLADQLAVTIGRMRLEEALRESEENAHLLADVLQKAAMPFGMGAPDGRLVLFNEAFERLTGYSGAELEERALTWSADFTPPEWRETEAAILARAASERRTVCYEKEYLRKDGTRVPIELHVQPVFDEAGTLLHYRSFLTDISARKQAEQRLLERETETARLDQGLPGSRTTRLVTRFRGHRWPVLVGAIAIQSAILLALNTTHDPHRVLGLPGSMIALMSVLAGALAGPLVGALVAAAGGGVFYLTVGGRGGQSTVFTTVVSTAIWVTAGLLSGFLANTLSEQAERRRAAAVALVRADAAREAQLAVQARVEELAAGLQLQTEDLQAAGEELATQRDELHRQNEELSLQRDRLAERATRMSLLKELAEVGASSLGQVETAQRQVEMLMGTLQARTIFLFVADDSGQHLVPMAFEGVTGEYLKQHAGPIEVAGDGASAKVFRSRQPSFIRDVESDPTLSESGRAFTLSLGQQAGAALPLLVRDEAIGCLAVAWAEPHALDADEVSFLESVAFEVALDLENARLYEREAEAARLAAVLNEMNGLINSTLDGREIMQTVVEQAVAAVGADSAMVALRHGEDWVAEYGYPEVPGVIHESVRSDEAPFMITAVTERRPIAIDDCETDPRCVPEVQRRFGVRSVLCLPLIVREEVLGVIFFNHHEAAVAFPPAIVEFAGKLAASFSTALANARLYEEQQRIATTLQENFLHELPTVAGLELGVVTKTAFEPELVGGDFSDVFVVDDTHVVVLIGDVAGKGVRAAGLTETVRSTVRALAAVDSSPAFILGKTNELLLRYDPNEAHVTAFIAVIDPRTGHLTYASAGHPAPVHLGAFTCRTLDVAFGPPLGTFERPYTNAHAMLMLEDYLVLYTDGVTEARCGGELLGEGRLLEIVADLRGRSAQEVADSVRDAALAFAGRLRDDLQVVALRLA
jgi:PAS domain S-box-containing protein